ncbi:MAG TPA: flagellar biosynthesis anti-sigma factor FlgM [Deltaproteobacteria bacterium]|nr:flagellar biosynthesis anti-sigma factor FlgM [Deltaproteobacteria bacterium]
MKINNTMNTDALKAYGANAAQRPQPAGETSGKNKGSTVSIQDKVDISSKVRMFQDIKQTALEAPDIRTEKVKNIEQKITSGTYQADYSVIADKLLSTNISDKI